MLAATVASTRCPRSSNAWNAPSASATPAETRVVSSAQINRLEDLRCCKASAILRTSRSPRRRQAAAAHPSAVRGRRMDAITDLPLSSVHDRHHLHVRSLNPYKAAIPADSVTQAYAANYRDTSRAGDRLLQPAPSVSPSHRPDYPSYSGLGSPAIHGANVIERQVLQPRCRHCARREVLRPVYPSSSTSQCVALHCASPRCPIFRSYACVTQLCTMLSPPACLLFSPLEAIRVSTPRERALCSPFSSRRNGMPTCSISSQHAPASLATRSSLSCLCHQEPASQRHEARTGLATSGPHTLTPPTERAATRNPLTIRLPRIDSPPSSSSVSPGSRWDAHLGLFLKFDLEQLFTCSDPRSRPTLRLRKLDLSKPKPPASSSRQPQSREWVRSAYPDHSPDPRRALGVESVIFAMRATQSPMPPKRVGAPPLPSRTSRAQRGRRAAPHPSAARGRRLMRYEDGDGGDHGSGTAVVAIGRQHRCVCGSASRRRYHWTRAQPAQVWQFEHKDCASDSKGAVSLFVWFEPPLTPYFTQNMNTVGLPPTPQFSLRRTRPLLLRARPSLSRHRFRREEPTHRRRWNWSGIGKESSGAGGNTGGGAGRARGRHGRAAYVWVWPGGNAGRVFSRERRGEGREEDGSGVPAHGRGDARAVSPDTF
ncbi:hypothetical protein DFH06DRAFT_1141229 [Mycena polygramma]|nr:hypothetical protein DFH06DRAFT_1141229 [Mycena polygramma]